MTTIGNRESKKLGIGYGELFGACVVLISAGLMFWRNTDVRLTALELRMDRTEKAHEEVIYKLDKVQESINKVHLQLKDKQDRKD